MTIKEKEVLIMLTGKNVKHFESLGYEIPTRKDKRRKTTTSQGIEILVKVEHLMKSSHKELTKICDDCGKEVVQSFKNIMSSRKKNTFGDSKDRCSECSANKVRVARIKKLRQDKCIALTNPELIEIFWNKEDPWKYTKGSNKKADFKCPNCGSRIKEKVINSICERGLSCPSCSDGISYPEKFTFSMLTQTGIGFENEKVFEWAKDKRYDFYSSSLNMIIEVHGLQHYELAHRGRSLAEEQANDRLKKRIAKKKLKGVRYIVIDARNSSLEWLRNSIRNSFLAKLFDLSNIDWEKCHKDACSSWAKKAWDLWNDGKTMLEISKEMGLQKNAIIRYLKQGNEADKVNYNREEAHKRGVTNNYRKIVKLTTEGEFIAEYDSIKEVNLELGIEYVGNISKCCSGKAETAFGHKWMYAEDYYEAIAHGEKIQPCKKRKREIVQLTLDGVFVAEFKSIKIAERATGIYHISCVCRGERSRAGDYIWMYAEDYCNIISSGGRIEPVKKGNRNRRIVQLDKNGKYIREFCNAEEARRFLEKSSGSKISQCCNGTRKTIYGYKWMYAEDYYQSSLIQ